MKRIAVLLLGFAAACSDEVPGPTDLAQASVAPAVAVAAGAETCSQPLVLSAKLAHPDGLGVKLEVELRPAGEALTGARTHESAQVSAGTSASVQISGLAPSTSYHWAARTVDAEGEASAWVEFAGGFSLCADPAVFNPATARLAVPAGVDTTGWKVHAGLLSSASAAGGSATVQVLDDQPQLLFALNAQGGMALMALKATGARDVELSPKSTVQALSMLSGVMVREYLDGEPLVQTVMDETTEMNAAASVLAARLVQGSGALEDSDVIAAAMSGAEAARIWLEARRPREWVRIVKPPGAQDGLTLTKKTAVAGGKVSIDVTNTYARTADVYAEKEDGSTVGSAVVAPASLGNLLKLKLPKETVTPVTFPLQANETLRLKFYGLGTAGDPAWDSEPNKTRVLRPAAVTVVEQFVLPILKLLMKQSVAEKAVKDAKQKLVAFLIRDAELAQKLLKSEAAKVMVKLVTECVKAALTDGELANAIFGAAKDEAIGKAFEKVLGSLKLAVEIGVKLSEILTATWQMFASRPLIVFSLENVPPDVALHVASDNEGLAPLRVTMQAYVPPTPRIVHYKWDYEGNGSWDTEGDSFSEVTHIYAEEGKYWPRLHVTDDDGATEMVIPSDPIVVLVGRLKVTEGRLDAAGPRGAGPFMPEALELWVSSTVEATDIPWEATVTSPQFLEPTDWVTVNPITGHAPYGTRKVTVTIDQAKARQLLAGGHLILVNFKDLDSGSETSRIVSLTVSPPVAVLPTTGFATAGPPGGPFPAPDAETYTLTADGATVDFTAAVDVAWLDVSESSGKATPAGKAITVRLNSAASSLAPGTEPHVGTLRLRYADGGPVFATRLFEVTVTGTEAVGEPDPSFNAAGPTPGTVQFGTQANTAALAKGPGGTILVVGADSNAATVWRFTADGTSDTSFGNGGAARFPGPARLTDMATDSQGRIVVAGRAVLADDNLFVMRLLADGRSDSSFGQGSVFTHQVGSNTDAYVYAVAIDAQDRPVVAGYVWPSVGSGNADLAVWRLTAAGALNPSFGTMGFVQRANIMNTTMPDVTSEMAIALEIDAQGRVVLAGMADTESGDGMLLMRFNPDGTPNTSFAGQGWLVDKPAQQVVANSLALDASGRIVVGGQNKVSTGFDLALWRWTTSGTLDSSFAAGGRVTFDVGTTGDRIVKVLVDAGGKLVFAGNAASSNLGRCTEAGALDVTFGGGDGMVLPGVPNAYDAMLDGQGRIVLLTQKQLMRFK